MQDLAGALQGREYFTVEELAEELSISQGDVHRALLKLRVQPGWSIIERNQIADGRCWPGGSGRNKPKTSSLTDYEPEWEPAEFYINKRGD